VQVQPQVQPQVKIQPQVTKHVALDESEPTVFEPPIPNVAITRRGESLNPSNNGYYDLPPVSLLSDGVTEAGESEEMIKRNKAVLQDVLDSFKIDGQVDGHISGPRVTRYDISLAPGVDVNKISKLENNIKMNLRVKSIRILAPIPGRDAVGVEIPNQTSMAVYASEIMRTEAWRKSSYDIPVVLGKNVSGEPVVMELAKAPHLLIAGTTGSGKSVCMNTLILSLLMRFNLDDLRLILVDPKVVEHAPYQTLPQLITPVINDAEKVPLALRWAVMEMEKRYRQLADVRVKTLKEYNNLVAGNRAGGTKMPYLIIILDELADLMMTEAKGEIETSINRIAAKGRAAGIHIVVATQSPRRDVITGLIKANLPTRISFAVSSYMDSRVILDRNGAETLLGRGDMLFLKGGAEMERIQGAIVPEEDITNVVSFISRQARPDFNSDVMSDPEAADETDSGEEENPSSGRDFRKITVSNAGPLVKKYLQPGDDDLVARALEVILVDRKASTSALQRRLKIGYNRAADLMDLFEERGMIGPDQQGGKPREVLVFDGLKNGNY